MKPICLMVLSAVLAVFASGPVVPAADDAKVVRLAWFPRFSPDGASVLSAHGSWDKKQGGEARLLAAKDGRQRWAFFQSGGSH